MIEKGILSNIDWEKVLEIEKHIYKTSPFKIKIRLFFKALYKTFIFHPILNTQKITTDFLFIKVMQRDDYDKLFQQIIDTCPKKKHVINLNYKKSKLIRFFPFHVLSRHFMLIFSLWDRNLLRSIYLFPIILQYLEIYEKINRLINYKHLVVFSDMQSIENLLVQSARLSGFSTTTMQHGLYIDYAGFENINIVNYKNQVSEYFLAWGDDTKSLIHQWHPDTKVIICGKPLEDLSLSNEKSDYFTILFDQNLLRSYNREMLKIAYQLRETINLKVNIRFHPRNNPKSYRIRQKTTYINKDIEGSKFIIGHTTSMIHEIMRFGIPVFKYRSKIPALTIPENIVFSTAEELGAKVIKHQKEQFDFNDYAKRYIQYIGDESLDKYKKTFKRIENGEI